MSKPIKLEEKDCRYIYSLLTNIIKINKESGKDNQNSYIKHYEQQRRDILKKCKKYNLEKE